MMMTRAYAIGRHAGQRQPAVPRHRVLVRLRRAAVRRRGDAAGDGRHAADRRAPASRATLLRSARSRAGRRRCSDLEAEPMTTTARTLISADTLRTLLRRRDAAGAARRELRPRRHRRRRARLRDGASAGRALPAPRPRPVRRRRPAATAATRCPTRETFAATAGALGIAPGDAGGRATTARARRMRRARGGCCAGSATTTVAVLDGGSSAWHAAGGALEHRRCRAHRRSRPTRSARRGADAIDAAALRRGARPRAG